MSSKYHRTATWVPAARALHLIDIENLVGMPPVLATESDFKEAADRYREQARPGPLDQFIVASDRANAFKAAAAFPGAQLVCGAGPDGADRALLDAIDADDVATRFDRVFVGSGDCAFTWLCCELDDRGLDVTAITRSGSFSGRLANAVRDVRYVDGPDARRRLQRLGAAGVRISTAA